MLEIRNLSAGYPGAPVLSELCLELPAGQVTVIAGPNGCGKSTLLKALAGILPATGSVMLDGQPLLGLSGKELAKKVAYLPQNRPIPEITSQRLVLHGRFPYLSYPRRYRAEDYAAAERAMARLGIGDLAHRELGSLSGGQRQKVYIAMALAQDTPVVLMDEPNTFLDIAQQLQMMRLAGLLAQEGKTVVLVLHDLAMAMESGCRLALLDWGHAICQGSAEEVFASGTLDRVFGVAVKRMQTPEGWKYYYVSR